MGEDDRPFDKNESVFQAAFQFPDIARPGIAAEGSDHFGIDGTDVFRVALVEYLDEMIDEQRNVLSDRRTRGICAPHALTCWEDE